MASGAVNLGLILAAVRAGRVPPSSAREWARRAADGEDISIVARLAAPSGDAAISAAAVNQLAGELAAILGQLDMAPDEVGVYDELFGADRAGRRARAIEAAAQRVQEMPENGLYDVLFGG